MIFLIIALAILIIIWGVGRGLIQIRPGSTVRLTRAIAVSACIAIAILFALRGHFEISFLAIGAIWLIDGAIKFPQLRFGRGTTRGSTGSGGGAVSTFRTAMIEMPCQIVRGGGRLIYRLLSWKPWQGAFLRLVERLHGCWLY